MAVEEGREAFDDKESGVGVVVTQAVPLEVRQRLEAVQRLLGSQGQAHYRVIQRECARS